MMMHKFISLTIEKYAMREMLKKERLSQCAIFIKTPGWYLKNRAKHWKIFYTSYTKIASIYYY